MGSTYIIKANGSTTHSKGNGGSKEEPVSHSGELLAVEAKMQKRTASVGFPYKTSRARGSEQAGQTINNESYNEHTARSSDRFRSQPTSGHAPSTQMMPMMNLDHVSVFGSEALAKQSPFSERCWSHVDHEVRAGERPCLVSLRPLCVYESSG